MSVRVSSEPVNAKNARRVLQLPTKVKPVVKVVGHVVPCEWQHCEWVASYFSDLACSRSRSLRTHCSGGIDTVVPVESLINQRHRGSSTATKDESRYRNSL